MSFDAPSMPELETGDLFIGIVSTLYNEALVRALTQRCIDALQEVGVPEAHIQIAQVPGANELPYASYMLGMTGQFDCVIALGVVIAGETSHHDIIAHSTAGAFHDIGMRTEVPVINGVLTVNNLEQAEARITGEHDRGAEFARAAVQMATHKVNWTGYLDDLEMQRRSAGQGGETDTTEN